VGNSPPPTSSDVEYTVRKLLEQYGKNYFFFIEMLDKIKFNIERRVGKNLQIHQVVIQSYTEAYREEPRSQRSPASPEQHQEERGKRVEIPGPRESSAHTNPEQLLCPLEKQMRSNKSAPALL
jgi:hypothetical protein